MNSYILANITLFIITIFALLFSIFRPFQFASLLNVLDEPNKNLLKIHDKAIPKNGGFIILFTFSIYLFLNNIYNFDSFSFKIYFFIFLFFLIGLIDDYVSLKPVTRIILFSLITYFFLILNQDFIVEYFYIENINNFFSLKLYSVFFTIFCFLFLQNSLNMLDGINGSLSIYAILLTTVIIFFNPKLYYIIFFFSLIICIILNIKNKIFLGNSGAAIISFLISLLLIETHLILPKKFSAEIILLICFLPAVDMLRLFVERIYNRKSPFAGDLNHFHHIVLYKKSNVIWITLLIILYLTLSLLAFYISVNIAFILSIAIYFYLLWKFK